MFIATLIVLGGIALYININVGYLFGVWQWNFYRRNSQTKASHRILKEILWPLGGYWMPICKWSEKSYVATMTFLWLVKIVFNLLALVLLLFLSLLNLFALFFYESGPIFPKILFRVLTKPARSLTKSNGPTVKDLFAQWRKNISGIPAETNLL